MARKPATIISTLRIIDHVTDFLTRPGRPVDAVLAEETGRRIAARRASPEGREGLEAFLSKRAPAWRRG